MIQDCALIIFAKAPLPGFAKTRLAPMLGDDGAARLAARMLEHTLACAAEAGVGPVELCCTPDITHPRFQDALGRFGVSLAAQGEGDLGERMHRALARTLERFPRAVLIGTDAPGLCAGTLRAAAHALRERTSVFAPASDGGYVLVGLSRPVPQLFEGIAWSTSRVMSQTRERIGRLGISSLELATMHDVDEPQDLTHVPPEWLA